MFGVLPSPDVQTNDDVDEYLHHHLDHSGNHCHHSIRTKDGRSSGKKKNIILSIPLVKNDYPFLGIGNQVGEELQSIRKQCRIV